MAAYSPRTDLLTPSVAPDTEGYGPGLTAGMNNFSRLMEMGITNQRQDDRDQLAYDRKTGMVDRSEGRADQKTLMTKADEVDFTDGLFDSIQMQMPDLISDEMNQRYRASSLPGKRAIAMQAQASYAAAMKSEMEAKERAAKAAAATQFNRVPGSNYIANGMGQIIPLPAENYGVPGTPATGANMWEGQGPTFDELPASPSWFTNLPNRPVKPSAQPAPATGLPGSAPTAAPSRRDSSAANYYNMGRP
jgi:hypothetical protein